MDSHRIARRAAYFGPPAFPDIGVEPGLIVALDRSAFPLSVQTLGGPISLTEVHP